MVSHTCARRGLRHIRTRPYTPRTNAKAKRFIQTGLREWACAQAYASSQRRQDALALWLTHYNTVRLHAALANRPLIAVAVTTEGRREIVGLGLGPSEAEPFWSTFLKELVKRGLKGVKLVISDAHDGLRLAITRVLGASWQRCRGHWIRNALAHVPKGQHTMVAAAIRQAFLQTDAAAAHQTWRHVADQLRPRWPKLAVLMDDSEHDVLAYMPFQRSTAPSCTAPIRSNVSTRRSSAAPMSSASSPTKPALPG